MSTFVDVIEDGDVVTVDVPQDDTATVVEILIEGPQGPPGSSSIGGVVVVDGTEARPDAPVVVWRDGRTPEGSLPANFDIDADIWVKIAS